MLAGLLGAKGRLTGSSSRRTRGENKCCKPSQRRKSIHDLLTLSRYCITADKFGFLATKFLFDQPRQNSLHSPAVDKNYDFLISLGDLFELFERIARGRRWLDEIVSGLAIDIEQIATRQKCSVRQVNMTISLAFLAPDLVKAAVEGRLRPRLK